MSTSLASTTLRRTGNGTAALAEAACSVPAKLARFLPRKVRCTTLSFRRPLSGGSKLLGAI